MLKIAHIAQGSMRRNDDFGFQRDIGVQLLQHAFGRAVAVVRADIGVAVFVAGE